MPRPLRVRTLPHHGRRLAVPTYDRSALVRGVVHIGVGSFHRAHQAVYFDELARRGRGDGWALTGVGLHRREMKAVLDAQDGLYTVLARGREGDDARVVGIITRYLFAPEQTAEVLDALVDESTRLVTLTITAAGYRPEPPSAMGTGGLAAPTLTAINLLVEALDRRRRLGRAPFTVLSCDNLVDNGKVARAAVLSLAGRRDRALARWIAERVAFPSSMVDRITPGTTDETRRFLEDRYGVCDRWPVVTEPFSQWVVEDNFCNGRPPLDEVGVQFVPKVAPYAMVKTRLLNASHSAIGYLGSLAGHERSDQAMRDSVIASYVGQLMGEEIAPLLPQVDMDLAAYRATLRERLMNPAVADPLARLCRNGSSKVPAHLLSSIQQARTAGMPHSLLILAVSAWCRYLRGSCWGAPAVLEDANGERLRDLARAGGNDPRPLLSDALTFGALAGCPRLARSVSRDLDEMDKVGVRTTIVSRLGNQLARSAQQAA
ncbi:MAG TPA: mannitol dehydrogenase family protein [Solirubrobacteraceae bacterium]|nr:mannitol dehydrogenase family protein [Solirubrobacteraceae bacterium]